VDGVDERAGNVAAADERVNEVARLGALERVEFDGDRAVVGEQVTIGQERVVVGERLSTVRADETDWRGRQLGRQEPTEIERRRVRPVKVVDEHDERPVIVRTRTEAVRDVGEQRPALRVELLLVGDLETGFDRERGVADCVPDRAVRGVPVAVALCDVCGDVVGLLECPFDDGGLPDPCGTGDEDSPCFAVADRVECVRERGELLVPADELLGDLVLEVEVPVVGDGRDRREERAVVRFDDRFDGHSRAVAVGMHDHLVVSNRALEAVSATAARWRQPVRRSLVAVPHRVLGDVAGRDEFVECRNESDAVGHRFAQSQRISEPGRRRR
jgi:hypothetical protein